MPSQGTLSFLRAIVDAVGNDVAVKGRRIGRYTESKNRPGLLWDLTSLVRVGSRNLVCSCGGVLGFTYYLAL